MDLTKTNMTVVFYSPALLFYKCFSTDSDKVVSYKINVYLCVFPMKLR